MYVIEHAEELGVDKRSALTMDARWMCQATLTDGIKTLAVRSDFAGRICWWPSGGVGILVGTIRARAVGSRLKVW